VVKVRPLDEVLQEARLALEKGESFEYCETPGVNRLASYCIEVNSERGYEEDEDLPIKVDVFIEVLQPVSLLEFDPDGIRALMREYADSLAALRAILETMKDLDKVTLSLIEEEYKFHEDLIHYSTPLADLDNAREIILAARAGFGLREPLTMTGFQGLEAEIYRKLITAFVRSLILTAHEGKTPGPEGAGWITPGELARELGADKERVEKALASLTAQGYVEEQDGKYRARPGTGAFAEALSNIPEQEACLLAPYAVGYKHREWRIFYLNDEDCIDLHRKLIKLESKGARIL